MPLTLESVTLGALKELASENDIEFAYDITKDGLIDLIREAGLDPFVPGAPSSETPLPDTQAPTKVEATQDSRRFGLRVRFETVTNFNPRSASRLEELLNDGWTLQGTAGVGGSMRILLTRYEELAQPDEPKTIQKEPPTIEPPDSYIIESLDVEDDDDFEIDPTKPVPIEKVL